MVPVASLYRASREFLMGFEGVDAAVLDLHTASPPPSARPPTLAGICRALLTSAQNAQMSPNVIGKAVSGIKGEIGPLATILCDFEPAAIDTRFAKTEPSELFEIVKPVLKRIPERTAIWLRFCKTIPSAAVFLKNFADAEEFYRFADSYVSDFDKRFDFPSVVAEQVEGLGYALACDFMLGLGYAEFGKPDVHVKHILWDLGLLKTKRIEGQAADIESLRLLDAAAVAAGVTVYAVDKLLWLIGSGDLYLAQPRFAIGRQREAFRNWAATRGDPS